MMLLKVDSQSGQQLLSFVLCVQYLLPTPENVSKRTYHGFKSCSTAVNHKCLHACTVAQPTNGRADHGLNIALRTSGPDGIWSEHAVVWGRNVHVSMLVLS